MDDELRQALVDASVASGTDPEAADLRIALATLLAQPPPQPLNPIVRAVILELARQVSRLYSRLVPKPPPAPPTPPTPPAPPPAPQPPAPPPDTTPGGNATVFLEPAALPASTGCQLTVVERVTRDPDGRTLTERATYYRW